MDEIRKQDNYVLMFDESFNFENQKKQLDIYVRFWEFDTVNPRYYGSEFHGHAIKQI